MIRTEDGSRAVVDVTYDLAGQLVARALGRDSKEEYAYDLRGGLIVAKNRDVEVRFERDAIGRVIRETQIAGELSQVGHICGALRPPSFADEHEQRVRDQVVDTLERTQQYLVSLDPAVHEMWRRERPIGAGRIEIRHITHNRPVRGDAEFPADAQPVGRGRIEQGLVLTVVNQLDQVP